MPREIPLPMHLPTLLGLILVTSSACSEEPGSAPELCAAICEHDLACDGAATCDACGLEPDLLRPEARDAMTACYQALTCTENDDQCLEDAIVASPVRDLDDQFAELCLDAARTCGFGDDICTLSMVFTAAAVEDGIACFDGTCNVDACLDAAFGL